MSITQELAATHLGKRSDGSEVYDKSLLVAVPRYENRQQYEIDENNLPFEGFDVWNAYEFSSMTENGVPYTRVLKLRYPANSKYIVESKSLKLYLNSFNMSRFGKTIEEGLASCKKIIAEDLSKKLETNVEIAFLTDTSIDRVFSDYVLINSLVDIDNVIIEKFQEAPEEITISNISESSKEYKIKFDSVRSNCRVTKQPDWADFLLYYKSKKHLSEEGLLKYMTSFRKENHFHEECVEAVFKRISDVLDEEDSLLVCAMYTRRGGIDINPVRYKNCSIEVLQDIIKLHDLSTQVRCNIKQ